LEKQCAYILEFGMKANTNPSPPGGPVLLSFLKEICVLKMSIAMEMSQSYIQKEVLVTDNGRKVCMDPGEDRIILDTRGEG
jgi:hypothetical protein